MDSFALWIIPEGEAYALTDGYIARLSAGYNLPKFEPHLTILVGLRSPRDSALRDLAGGLSPFRIRLTEQPAYLDEHFRCLFLKADKTPALMEAYSKASQIFGFEEEPYFPHLSLAYGNLPVETKGEMIRELGEIPRIEFEAHQFSLVQASREMSVSSWKVVERFPLAKAL